MAQRFSFTAFLVFAFLVGFTTIGTFPAVATAFPAVLSLGQSATVSASGITFTQPADGRLRTTNYAAQVTGVAWPADDEALEISPPDQLVPGPTGPVTTTASTRLVVFTLSFASPANSQAPSPTASITYAGGQSALDISAQISSAPSTGTYGVAVPLHDHSVSLVLAEGGMTATFSLWNLTRTGDAPQVLYRDPSNTTVSVTTSQAQSLPVTRDSDGATNPQTVTLSGATLSFVSPQGTPAPSPDQAYLSLNISATYHYDSSVDFFEDFQHLPTTMLTLTVPDSAPIASQVYSTATDSFSGPEDDDRLLDGTFYFAVPASLTFATLTISPGAVTGNSFFNSMGAGPPEAFHITSPVDFTVNLPAPAAPVIQVPPHWPAAVHTQSLAVPATSGKGGSPASGGLPIGVALAVLVVVAAGVVGTEEFIRRGRARGTDGDSNRLEPPALPPEPVIQSRPAGDKAPVAQPIECSDTTGVQAMDSVPTDESGDHGDTIPTDQIHHLEPATVAATANPRPPAVTVKVLGVVEVTGCSLTGRSAVIATEILVYLATHRGRPITADDIALALWPAGGERGEPATKTVRNYVSSLRQILGSDLLAPAANGGYCISEKVRCDWDEFVSLARMADRGGPEALALRLQALELVAGRPFTRPPGAKRGSYEWPAAEQLATRIENAIVACAQEAVAELRGVGDLESGEEAARRAFRATGDPRAARALWQVVSESGNVKRVEAAKRDIVAELGKDEFDAVVDAVAGEVTSAP